MSYLGAQTMAKHYSQVNLFFRSLTFSVFAIIFIILYSFLCLFSRLISLENRHYLIRIFLKIYMGALQKICLINYEVEGLENIPKNRAAVVLSKHQSTWEAFFLPLIFRDPAVIVKRELLWIPFFGWGLSASDPIVINRSNKSNAMQQVINKGRKALAAGRWVLIFPEGTRVPYGQVGHYKLGGARLASATGYPVVPVAHNAGLFWPRRKFIKQPGTVKVVIGPPIESENKTPDEILKLTKQWIEETMTRIDGLVDKPTR